MNLNQFCIGDYYLTKLSKYILYQLDPMVEVNEMSIRKKKVIKE